MVRTWTLLGALCLSATACGGSDDDMFRARTVPLEDLPELYAEAVCESYTRCLGPLVDVFLRGEDCVQRTSTALSDQLPAFQAAIDAGRIRYRGDEIETCTSDVAARSCSELLEREAPSCLAAFDGSVALGGACTLNEECEGIAYCKFDATCPGVCSELEAAGATCDRDSHCASGLVCSRTTRRCEEPAAQGALCQAGYPDCAPGFACAGASEAEARPGNCRTYTEVFNAAAGAACDPVTGQLCQAGQVCQIDSVVGGAITASCASRVNAGAACRAAFPDQCPDGQYCLVAAGTLEGTCTPRPAPGQPCGRGPFDDAGSICGAYGRCEAGTCRALAHLGESCGGNDVCYSEHCLNGVCVAGGGCE